MTPASGDLPEHLVAIMITLVQYPLATPEELAFVMEEPVVTIRAGLEELVSRGMVDTYSEGIIRLDLEQGQ